VKYFVQFQRPCPKCKRDTVDIVTTDESPEYMYSRHFPTGKFEFCVNSLQELKK
jgi:hypothetical protein